MVTPDHNAAIVPITGTMEVKIGLVAEDDMVHNIGIYCLLFNDPVSDFEYQFHVVNMEMGNFVRIRRYIYLRKYFL